MNLGKSIKVACAMTDNDQAGLAKHLLRSEQTISNYVKGRQKPAIDTVALMAEFFGMKTSEFIKLGEK